MSVFGGDSWAREAQQRKRRVDHLLLSSSSSSSSSSSYKKLSNGKYACLLCPNNPVLDSPLMISMHNKGSRHITAESKLNEGEVSRRDEVNKRVALASDSAGVSTFGTLIRKPKHSEVRCKALIEEETRRAILAIKCSTLQEPNARDGCSITEPDNPSSSCDPKFLPLSMRRNECESVVEKNDRTTELCKGREKELKLTAAGWKRDGHGKWYRDDNVEFDSDEEDPNDSLI